MQALIFSVIFKGLFNKFNSVRGCDLQRVVVRIFNEIHTNPLSGIFSHTSEMMLHFARQFSTDARDGQMCDYVVLIAPTGSLTFLDNSINLSVIVGIKHDSWKK